MSQKINPQLYNLMEGRKHAYTQLLGDPNNSAAQIVMSDLSRFCREKTSTFNPDERLHCLLEGRREVMLRMRDYVDLSIEELCHKYGRTD